MGRNGTRSYRNYLPVSKYIQRCISDRFRNRSGLLVIDHFLWLGIGYFLLN